MTSTITIRRATPADEANVGRVIYQGFRSIAERHNFPLDFPSIDVANHFAGWVLRHNSYYGVVAEIDGKFAGSNFLDERGQVTAVGPITIDPAFQGRGAGRKLMQAVIEHANGCRGIRLVQDAFNTVSMPLYASLGFEIKEPLVLMRGKPNGHASGTGEVRAMREQDLDGCAALCRQVHGLERTNELRDAMTMFKPFVLVRGGRVIAYASSPTFWPLNHGAAQSEQDLTDLLLGASAALGGPLELLVPTRQSSLFRWCIAAGLRVVKPANLMAIGHYQEPAGAYYPSVMY